MAQIAQVLGQMKNDIQKGNISKSQKKVKEEREGELSGTPSFLHYINALIYILIIYILTALVTYG